MFSNPNSFDFDDRNATPAPRDPITLVFTDMVDSSAAKQASSLGDNAGERDSAYLESIQSRHVRLVRECVATHQGREIMTIGDSFFLTFQDPRSALMCGKELQLRLRSEPIVTGFGRLRLRIGIHIGRPRYFENSWYGTDVDTAARAQSIGSPDQVIITEAVERALGSMPDVSIRPLGVFALKGVGEVRLFDADYDAHGLRRARVPSIEEIRSGERMNLAEPEVVTIEGGIIVISLKGRLVLGPQISHLETEIQTLARDGAEKVILDMEEIEYADSAGLGVLLHASGAMRAVGGQLLLAGPNRRLRDLFKLTGTTNLLAIYPDRASCLAQLS
jgi:anti-sigma B factor antagonist